MARSRWHHIIPLATLLASGLVATSGTSPSVRAAHETEQGAYRVSILDSVGGTVSAGSTINNRGWIAGYSNDSDDATVQATLWRGRRVTPLGTLGGPNSAVLWPVKNDNGIVVGISETAELDEREENWSCSAFFPGEPTHHVCRGFVWKHGTMRALPTLGGTHGFAASVNDRGQAVGWSENGVEDPTCNPPQVLQFRATLWDLHRGRTRELPPYGDDTVSAATAINDRGQVVGISGICDNAVGRHSARHAVMWDDGEVVDLGNIGGDAWSTPMAINRHGHVVGFTNAEPGPALRPHAFVWTEGGGLEDLGAIDDDTTSQAVGINRHDQVVGLSCGASGCRAFLHQGGMMTDLNTLVAGDPSMHLVAANDINDRGEITGQAIDLETNEAVAFVARPTCRR